MRINLNSVKDIQEFVNIVSKFSDDIDVSSSRSMVDAKSIMGLFSLDLSKPVEVTTSGTHSDNIYAAISKYAS
ncbi:MAG: HPr family phosphocarrier protein [Eubacterium sp.]